MLLESVNLPAEDKFHTQQDFNWRKMNERALKNFWQHKRTIGIIESLGEQQIQRFYLPYQHCSGELLWRNHTEKLKSDHNHYKQYKLLREYSQCHIMPLHREPENKYSTANLLLPITQILSKIPVKTDKPKIPWW